MYYSEYYQVSQQKLFVCSAVPVVSPFPIEKTKDFCYKCAMHEEKMRRSDKQISEKEAYEELKTGEYGVLGLVDKDGSPYTVPLNYCVDEQNIYFHGALTGRKLRALTAESRVSFSVVTSNKVRPAEFTSFYRSVHVHGKARIVETQKEKLRALTLIAAKYSPGLEKSAGQYIHKAGEKTTVIAVQIESIQGKKNPPSV